MLDKALTWPCALVLGLSYGCASVGGGGPVDQTLVEPELTSSSTDDEVHSAAEAWLSNHAFDHTDRTHTDLPRSYPGADGALGKRHYVYDAALALLWASWRGRENAAEAIAGELIERQRSDGRWPDALEVQDGAVEPSTSFPAGVAAWAAFALTYFDAKFDAPRAVRAARRTADGLMRTRIEGPEGCGTLVRSRPDADPMAVTEHQLDTIQLLHALGDHASADALLDDSLSCLWLAGEQRFATAATPEALVPQPALDAAGGWGALSLAAAGKRDAADASLAYTIDTFAVGHTTGFGFRPGLASESGDANFIFFEGSLGVALAASRLDRADLASKTLRTARDAAIEHNGGVPYASKAAPDFSDAVAISSTIWFLFADGEHRLDQRAPVFLAGAARSGNSAPQTN